MDQINYPKKAKPISTHEKLRTCLQQLYANQWSDHLSNDLPKKWKISAQNLLILPANCFLLEDWSKSDLLWHTVATCFKVTRIAIENRVKTKEP